MRMLVPLYLGLSFWVYAQKPKLDTLRVKSSVVCQTCRRTIIKGLSTQKGIRQVEVDIPSQSITIAYRPDRTTPHTIRQAIQRLGYDADTLPRDPAAYERLPACCKSEKPH